MKNKKYLLRKYVFATMLMVFIMGYSIANVVINYKAYIQNVANELDYFVSEDKSLKELIADIDVIFTDDAIFKMHFLEIFSYAHVLLGKEEIKNFEYIKDKNGSMNYAAFYRERDTKVFDYALRVKRLKDYVEANGTDVMFVIPPSKGDTKNADFSAGIPVNNRDRIVDELLFYLSRLGIDTINYADYMPNDEIPYEDLFFKTDHHWTIPAAFYATQILANGMNEKFGYELEVDEYLDESTYEKVLYKNAMFGSLGRGAGACFAGQDDYLAYYPTKDGSFTRETIYRTGKAETFTGGYYDTLIDKDVFKERNRYKNLAYSMYLSGIKPYNHIVNHDKPDGQKVFLISDSYFMPVICFMAPMVGQIDAIWSINQIGESIEERLANEKYDCVIIEVYPYNINGDAFQFFVNE